MERITTAGIRLQPTEIIRIVFQESIAIRFKALRIVGGSRDESSFSLTPY